MKYRIKKSGIYHRGINDETARPYTVGDIIDLTDNDAQLLSDYLAGENDKIVMQDLIPKEKFETMMKHLKTETEAKLDKVVKQKNKKITQLNADIDSLKKLNKSADRTINKIKIELKTTKNILANTNKKLEENNNKGVGK